MPILSSTDAPLPICVSQPTHTISPRMQELSPADPANSLETSAEQTHGLAHNMKPPKRSLTTVSAMTDLVATPLLDLSDTNIIYSNQPMTQEPTLIGTRYRFTGAWGNSGGGFGYKVSEDGAGRRITVITKPIVTKSPSVRHTNSQATADLSYDEESLSEISGFESDYTETESDGFDYFEGTDSESESDDSGVGSPFFPLVESAESILCVSPRGEDLSSSSQSLSDTSNSNSSSSTPPKQNAPKVEQTVHQLIQTKGAWNIEKLDFPQSMTDHVLTKAVSLCVNLVTLNIPDCLDVTDAGIRAVTERCLNLEFLNISGCKQLTSRAITLVPDLKDLYTFQVTDCPKIVPDSIIAIIKSCEKLNLLAYGDCSTEIGSNLIDAIINSKRKIQTISFGNAKVPNDLQVRLGLSYQKIQFSYELTENSSVSKDQGPYSVDIDGQSSPQLDPKKLLQEGALEFLTNLYNERTEAIEFLAGLYNEPTEAQSPSGVDIDGQSCPQLDPEILLQEGTIELLTSLYKEQGDAVELLASLNKETELVTTQAALTETPPARKRGRTRAATTSSANAGEPPAKRARRKR